MIYTEIEEKLKKLISHKRYLHSLGVAEFSKKLAIFYKYDVKKAYIAGLLHDCARDMDIDTLKEIVSKCNITIGEVEKYHPILLHAPAGACIAKERFGIDDEDVLQAITSHTILNKNPSLLDKIIYVADLAEIERDFEEAQLIRENAFSEIDKVVILCIDVTFRYLIGEHKMIHPITLYARNLLIKEVYYGKD